jgi:single-strand DNA-binding protein
VDRVGVPQMTPGSVLVRARPSRLLGMIDNLITLTGIVATTPRFVVASGVPIVNFRLASTTRKRDSTGKWVDGHTNWYDVAAYRRLAENIQASIDKGDSVVLTGHLRIKDWEGNGRSGRSVEVQCETVGHDLSFGTDRWTRRRAAAPDESAERDVPEPEEHDEPESAPPTDTADAWRSTLVDRPATADATPF